jgi:hypothetical protein
VTVVAGGEATLLREPGPAIGTDEWAVLEARIPDADVLWSPAAFRPGWTWTPSPASPHATSQ